MYILNFTFITSIYSSIFFLRNKLMGMVISVKYHLRFLQYTTLYIRDKLMGSEGLCSLKLMRELLCVTYYFYLSDSVVKI